MAQTQTKIKASTQDHLDVEDITENLVILKSGQVAMIMSTTAVNFDILSEAEQDATIYAYAAFLNSLSFPLQILIRSKKADITAYYQHLEESMRNQPNPDLKTQIQKYMEFIKLTVQQKTILDKQFYLIISYSTLDLGFRGFKRQKNNYNKPKAETIKDAKINLFPRRDHIIKQAARLGLTATQLSTKELIELFYDIYNPAPTGTQRIILDTASYSAPLVKPAIESPAPYRPSTQPAPITPQSNAAGVPAPQPGAAASQPPPQPILNQVPIQPSISNPMVTPANQQQALKNLQTATQKAASFVSGRQQALGQQTQAPLQSQKPIQYEK